MKCTKCGRQLTKLDRYTEMADLDDDATEGQMADYFVAVESGDCGSWGYGAIEYFCERCRLSVEVVMEELSNYRSLIKGWHVKARQQEDYFSKFVFEYLAFIAHLKNNLFFDENNDRLAIQRLKQSTFLKNEYFEMLRKDESLKNTWSNLLNELNESPLHNSSFDYDVPELDKWWNSNGHEPNRDDALKKGVVHGFDDWGNMVEFWTGVRNNLFHGGKNPNIKRDQFLVKHSYLTLSAFMDIEVKKL